MSWVKNHDLALFRGVYELAGNAQAIMVVK